MINRYPVPLFVVLAVCALAACGGGGGGGGGGSTPPGPTSTPSPTATPKTCTAYGSAPAGDRRLAPRTIGGVVPDELYVRYRSTAGARGIASVERSVPTVQALDIARQSDSVLRAVYLAPGSDGAAAASALRRDPNVVDVSPVHYRSPASDTSAGANDTWFENTDQWYLYKTNVVKTPNATVTGPVPGAWNNGSANSGSIKIAVIDTGVDLTGGDPVDFTVDRAVRIVQGQTSFGNAAVQDTDGHGTNTSGLAAATANNGYGFAGVGFNAHLMAYKIFPDTTAGNPCPTASTADESAAITDAVNNGATVISLSLGSPQSSGADTGEQNAIANAIANNVVVVAANGNEFPSSDGNQPDYPAGYPNVIGVGASAVQNSVANTYASITAETVASYSNSGPTLVAPGGDANTTNDKDILHWIEGYSTTTNPIPADQCSNSGSVCRVLFNGTSQATPQVAGTVALMEAYHGGARSLSVATVRALLISTTDPIPGVAQTRQGAGRLDAGKAVAAAHP